MIARPPDERMLTADERALLELWRTKGRAGYPIDFYATESQYSWSYKSLHAPRRYATLSEAVTAFEGYIAVLVESARAASEREYIIEDPRARAVAERRDD